MKKYSEEPIICAARRGDLWAFNTLVLAYQDRAYTQAYYLLGNPTAAEDAVAEAFIAAFQAISSFRDGSIQSWLSKIVTQKCMEKLSRGKSRPTKVRKSSNTPGKDINSPQPPPVPGLFLNEAEAEGLILRCMAHLSVEHRIILVLVDLLGLDYCEAAEITGCPTRMIQARLAQARLQMNQILQEDRACYQPVT